MMLVRKLLLLLSVYFLFSSVCGERGCPPSEEIEPCTCSESITVELRCGGITDTEKLLKVFHNAERYHFDEFYLMESTLQYLPHVIFNDISVQYMTLFKVTLINFFDEIPQNPGLKTININEVKIAGGWDWTKLSAFKELERLYLNDQPMKKLSRNFRPSISKNLKDLLIVWCQLKTLRDDEFQEFTQLEKFKVVHNELTTISRNMFSRPSKLKELFFDGNKIESIPEDMFSDMPDLEIIGFAQNNLTLLPANTFDSVIDHIKYLWFPANSIRCDCRIQWLTSLSKDITLFGECDSPSKLNTTQLEDLKHDDFRCDF